MAEFFEKEIDVTNPEDPEGPKIKKTFLHFRHKIDGAAAYEGRSKPEFERQFPKEFAEYLKSKEPSKEPAAPKAPKAPKKEKN